MTNKKYDWFMFIFYLIIILLSCWAGGKFGWVNDDYSVTLFLLTLFYGLYSWAKYADKVSSKSKRRK